VYRKERMYTDIAWHIQQKLFRWMPVARTWSGITLHGTQNIQFCTQFDAVWWQIPIM